MPEQFAQVLGWHLDEWRPVQAPARRRIWHYDGGGTLGVHVASTSDIDDVIPTLVAYQIEWNKLHTLLKADAHARAILDEAPQPDQAAADRLRDYLAIRPDDRQRLQRALGGSFWSTVRRIAASEKDVAVQRRKHRLGGRGQRHLLQRARRVWAVPATPPTWRSVLA